MRAKHCKLWVGFAAGVALLFLGALPSYAGFTEDTSAGIVGVSESSAAWGDYDNDGRLDLAVMGVNASAARVTKIYHNNGNGTFTDIGASLLGMSTGCLAWGDYDNDGYLDLAVVGTSNGASGTTKLYHNEGNGTFTDTGASIVGLMQSSLAWGDYDNDGRLDLLIIGTTTFG